MTRKARNKYNAVLIILALAAACIQFSNSWLQPASAQLADGSVRFVHYSITGWVPGQTARITVVNPGGHESRSIAFRALFFDQNGTLVFESARTEVPAAGFGQLDASYGDLGMDSEAETGRKQVRIEVVIEGSISANSIVLVNGEIVNQNTGATEVQVPKFWILTKHVG